MAEHETVQNQKQIIIAFRESIVDKIKPSELLPSLVASVSTLKLNAEEIRARESTDGRKKAAELFVDQLLNSHDAGWFQAFIDSLREKGYDDLVRKLEGTEATEGETDDSLYRSLLDIFQPALCNIKPSELIPYLLSKKCLSNEDEELILCRESTNGPTKAAYLLLEIIHCKKDDYFVHFMEALRQNGYEDIVNQIEPAYAKTCSIEGRRTVIEQIPRVYKKGGSALPTPASNVAVVLPQVSCMDMDEDGASQIEQEHQMQYDSMGADIDMDVMAENRLTTLEAESDETETQRKDETETSNLIHFHDNMDISRPSMDYHQNIPMTNNFNLPERGVADDAESVADNTRIPGAEAARGEPLELRNYQIELAQDAVEGKNTIVVAPTGSGKTHVALYIAENHLREAGMEDDAKVAFIVPTVSLVNQQTEMFKKYLSNKSTVGVCGDAASAKVSLGRLVPNNDIFILTPQILVDALNKDEAEIEISSFSLLIFDECHHTVKGHPYSKVMAHYLDKKLEGDRNLPQVVGLTASVGVGKAKDLPDAVDHILRLCASLDVEKLRTVQEHRQELLLHTPRAHEEETKEVPGRIVDPFKDEINELMRRIEERLTTDVREKGQQIGDLSKQLVAPSDRGSERYTQWVNSLKRPIAMIRDSNMKQLVFACIRHLKMHNEALLINAVCQSLDALKYVHDDMAQIKQAYPNETEVWLENIFKEREEALRKISRDVRWSNPKLERLREEIRKYYEEDIDSRGIVFCKTRAMTEALARWMRETPDLEWLNPKRLVAANAPTDKGGMEQSEQDDVLRYFRDGHHKIIIATSVAEEGLDIQACNFVIRYEHVTNETARIQARGRARKRGAGYVLVTEEGSGTAEKDELNKIREEMMDDAIRRIVNINPGDFAKRVKDFQKEAKQKRTMDLLGKQAHMTMKQARLGGDAHTLLCMKCDEFVCFSSDIRRIEKSHHVVVEPTFKDRAHIKKHHRPVEYDGMSKMGKLHCGKCDKDWGVVVRYRNVYFPVLKLSEFAVENPNGRRTWYKKWKDVPFVVNVLTAEEMKCVVGECKELVTVNF